MDRLDLRGGTPTASTVKRRSESVIAITRSASARKPALDVAERTVRNGSSLCFVETSREPRSFAGDAAVDVGVHEMCVHDVGAELAHEAREQQRVDVARRRRSASRGTRSAS